MRRLIRHSLALCAAASLTLCAAAVVLWVMSYRPGGATNGDVARWRRGDTVWAARSQAGSVRVVAIRLADRPAPGSSPLPPAPRDPAYLDSVWPEPDRSITLIHTFVDPIDTGAWWQRLGFGVASLDDVNFPSLGLHVRGFTMVKGPHAALVVITALLPALGAARALRRARARGRIKAGLCAACGYDLRASAGRCPECGMLVRGDAGHGASSA